MTRIDKVLSDLKKLSAKRDALDTQIQGLEKKFLAELKSAAHSPAPVAKKPAARKAAKKQEPQKPASPPPPKTNTQKKADGEVPSLRQKAVEAFRQKMRGLPWKNREQKPPQKK